MLTRFRRIVGVGNVTGPYRNGLYYWKTAKKETIDAVGAMLWPYLSGEKRRQFAAAAVRTNRALPAPIHCARAVKPEVEAAWAAGFFDAEGTFAAYAARHMRSSWRGVSMSIPQASATVVPEALLRFRAVVGVGTITGPRIVPSPWSRLPQYRSRAQGRHVVSAAVKRSGRG